MKHLTLGIALGIAVATPAMADPALGKWQTQPDDNGNFGHVEIAPCGAALCGTLVRAYGAGGAPRGRDRVGTRLLWDMAATGDGTYGGGKIYSPDRDKTYNSKMELSRDRLEVSGCVLGICRGQTWVRVQ